MNIQPPKNLKTIAITVTDQNGTVLTDFGTYREVARMVLLFRVV